MKLHNVVTSQALAHARRWLACGWRLRITALLLVALLLRALVPQGYMPAASTDQSVLFAMVVCTPDGPLSASNKHLLVQSDVQQTAPDVSESEHAKAVCSFSAMAWQMLLDGLWLALLLVLLLQAIRIVRPRYCAPVWAPCTDIRAARAPPLPV